MPSRRRTSTTSTSGSHTVRYSQCSAPVGRLGTAAARSFVRLVTECAALAPRVGSQWACRMVVASALAVASAVAPIQRRGWPSCARAIRHGRRDWGTCVLPGVVPVSTACTGAVPSPPFGALVHRASQVRILCSQQQSHRARVIIVCCPWSAATFSPRISRIDGSTCRASLYVPSCIILYRACCMLPAALLYAAWCMLYVIWCVVQVACCIKHVVHAAMRRWITAVT